MKCSRNQNNWKYDKDIEYGRAFSPKDLIFSWVCRATVAENKDYNFDDDI